MKKINVIFEADGEMSGTYSPKCFEESFSGDLSEKVLRLYSNDDWRQVEVPRWSIKMVEVPVWMTEALFIEWNWHIHFGYMQALTSRDFMADLSLERFKRMKDLSSEYQYFIGWLWEKNLKAKKENAFLLSVQQQVFDWLDVKNDFQLPLSQRQWEVATKFCPVYEARGISDRYYWAR